MPSAPRSTPRSRFGLLPLAGVAVVVGVAGVVWWIPSETELASRAAAMATERLGVPVTVGRLRWQLIPSPQVQLEDVATDQPQPVHFVRNARTERAPEGVSA